MTLEETERVDGDGVAEQSAIWPTNRGMRCIVISGARIELNEPGDRLRR
jgi:hypothetical protein